MAEPIVFLGSSRENGDTSRAVRTVFEDRPVTVIDLNKVDCTAFDYDNRNRNDDFSALAQRMIACDHIVLATPVY